MLHTKKEETEIERDTECEQYNINQAKQHKKLISDILVPSKMVKPSCIKSVHSAIAHWSPMCNDTSHFITLIQTYLSYLKSMY